MTNKDYEVSNETLEYSPTENSEPILDPPGQITEISEEIPDEHNGTSDYKFIIDMLKEMEEQYKFLKDIAITQAEVNFNLTKEVYTGIIPITKADIETMPIDDMKAFLSKYLIEDQVLPVDTDDDIKDMMNQLKDTSLQLLASKKDINEIKSESSDMMKDYFNYLSSPAIQEKRERQLAALKDAVEKTDDEVKKASMIRMIHTMEDAYSFAFLFERFNAFGDKEIKSIVGSFFDTRKGALVVNRFKSKIKKFGFDSMLYRYFFNLEENFLDEQYHVFNNLFLFIYMRFVSHADPYNKKDVMFVQSVTSALANLVYHKFNSTESEDKFKEIILRVVDKFMKYHDKFEKDNTTHPNHPIRIEIDNKKQKERRESLIAKMNELNITGYDENASADELQEYLNNSLDSMINSQIEANKEDEDQPEIIEEPAGDSSDENTVIDVVPVEDE